MALLEDEGMEVLPWELSGIEGVTFDASNNLIITYEGRQYIVLKKV
jgi:hypothetical protein